MLCGPCQTLFDKPILSRVSAHSLTKATLERDLRTLHANVASLEASLAQKCPFCVRLVAGFRRGGIFRHGRVIDAVDRDADFTLRCRLCPESRSNALISCFCIASAKVSGVVKKENSTIYLFLADDQEPLDDYSTSEADKADSRFPALPVVTSWMIKCCNGHQACRSARLSLKGRRFARILDLGAAEDNSGLKLTTADQRPQTFQYMTLSYCWGNTTEIPTLKTTNFDEYMQHIDFNKLPKTFQDAIVVTRCLAVRYLWIDSLCIMQDSREDWLKEAYIMGSVYASSYLNIAATGAEDPHGGLFRSPEAKFDKPLRIDLGEEPFAHLPDMQEAAGNENSLELVAGSIIKIRSDLWSPRYIHSKIDIDEILGNHDGWFSCDGKNVSQSARDVHLSDGVLHADLGTISGDWQHDSIELRGLDVFANLNQNNMTFKLEGRKLLTVISLAPDISPTGRRLDLNQHLGNNNGRFDVHGHNFGASARSIVLNGSTLRAELCKIDGEWTEDSIDIAPFLTEVFDKSELEYLQPNQPVPRKQRFYDVDASYYQRWSQNITTSKWAKRGWILQERLLAPRILHFTKTELFWECLEMRSIEEWHRTEINDRMPAASHTKLNFKLSDPFSDELLQHPKPRALGINYIWSSMKAMHGRDNTVGQKFDLVRDPEVLEAATRMCYRDDVWLPTHPLLRIWSETISCYSMADLTHQDDTMIAIAGIARTLAERSGIRYVAGLWEYQLPRQLLWSYTLKDADETVTGYIAPSWSWASDPSVLRVRSISLDPILESNGAMDIVKVLEIDVQGTSADDTMPFGQISSGHLRLRGRLYPMPLQVDEWKNTSVRKSKLVSMISPSIARFPEGPTFLVPVLFTRWNEHMPQSTCNSLILEWTGEKGVFRRIGTARLSSLCPLKAVPWNMNASSGEFEDEDDDATSDSEICEAETRDQFSKMVMSSKSSVPTPQQELMDNMINVIQSGRFKSTYENLTEHFKKKVAGASTADAQKLQAGARYLERLQKVMNHAATQFPETPRRKLAPVEDTSSFENSIAGVFPDAAVSVYMRNNKMASNRQPTTLSPKDAVAPPFYIDFLEDDEVTRYGHFIFDVI